MTTSAATVVLVAHGSRLDEANSAHLALADTLAGRTGATVVPAFLELAQPDIPTAIDAVIAAGATRVVVLPYFLLPGAHTTRDIPALIDEALQRHPGVEIAQAPHLGADPAVLDALSVQISRFDA